VDFIVLFDFFYRKLKPIHCITRL